MIRSLSRVLILAVLLTPLAAPMAHASLPGLLRPHESATSWVDTALSWLGRLLTPGETPAQPAPRIEVTNTTGSCIDPQGRPISCG
jgi:hypothetical protein